MSNKAKVLLLSDSMRYPSGVGTMAKHIVYNSVDKIDWLQLAPERDKIEQIEVINLSEEVRKITGVEDAQVGIIPYSSYGDMHVIRTILSTHAIDAIMIFTDPRYWQWLFKYEKEIRSKVPIIYYNIWDNDPTPFYNRPFYESVDSLIAISKLTERINEDVLEGSDSNTTIDYVPHGIDEKLFYPIRSQDQNWTAFNVFSQKFIKSPNQFIVFWNSRNMERKNPLDVIDSFRRFVDKLPSEQKNDALLVMHTDPRDQVGTDLIAFVKDNLTPEIQNQVKFSVDKLSDEHINYLYNIADVTVNISFNEGWGLSVTESIMAGTPVIALATGGIKDQIYYSDGKPGEWAYPLEPTSRNLIGNHNSPYIYTDRVSSDIVAEAMYTAYCDRFILEDKGVKGREWLIRNGMTAKVMATNIAEIIIETIEEFEVKSDIRYKLFKV